jgi:hemoglobin
MSTIFEKYGGFKAVSRLVMTFYDMVLDSDEIAHIFDDTDMPRLIDHQTKFVASLLGGPSSFSDDRLEQVHRALNISDRDFDEMIALLSAAMEEHGMAASDIALVAEVVESKRTLVVTRAAA